jgi:HK97 family phage portal protein
MMRQTANRLVKAVTGRSLDATFSAASGAVRSSAATGLSLITGRDLRGWDVGLDDTAHRILDDAPATLLQQMSQNEIVYACMKERQKALIEPKFLVERRQDDGSYVVDDDHELTALLRRPAPNIDTPGFWRSLETSYDAVGRIYIEPLYEGRRLAGLNPLNPTYIREDVEDGVLTGYTWKPPEGSTVRFGVDDLITRRAVLWADVPPLVAALGAIEADQVSNDFLRTFFAGSGVPTGIVKTRDEWPEETTSAFRETWRRLWGPNGTATGTPAVLDPRILDYERIGVSLNELDNETLRMYIETRIAMCFGVPPLIIYSYAGLLKATYSNLQEAWSSFWDATALPMLREYENFINWSILTRFESEDRVKLGLVRCRFDPSGLGPYQEDVAAKVAQYHEGYESGVVKMNEYRIALGLPPETGGDVFKADRQPDQPAILELPARQEVTNE